MISCAAASLPAWCYRASRSLSKSTIQPAAMFWYLVTVILLLLGVSGLAFGGASECIRDQLAATDIIIMVACVVAKSV